MPTYKYKCQKCEKVFEARHSMSFEPEDCSELPEDSKCDESGSIGKDYSSPITTKGTRSFEEDQKEDGDLVEEAIEENKRELNERKKEMKREDIDPEDIE